MSTVKFQSLSPNVVVDDVNQTVDYYTQNLGFKYITSVPESGKYNWAMVMRDGVTLMFQSLPSIQEDLPELLITKKGSMGTFFIEVQSIDTLYKQVKGKVDIVGEMRTTFYGKKEFTIKDLNGYFLMFAEDVK
jgi:uncharacterized glyoxalase superfamily protein PhnB